ncbi:hypothetical protein OS493_020595 [Desmophyllum pertusum]|uniref:Uncharacterized protein n=1 Tax=Desmophyllum pertusum TaxID=174260 RepID=A0A9W9YZ40_9CNID|nr:hypothetical protein OS493_031316 [Desmophyllum pertusum]KAJ7372166.1 hypothetical protein OS493_020595 [Desmophyllum pertusum]
MDQDISEYTYERTLLMEQIHQMFREIQLSRKESKREIQDVVEHSWKRRSLSARRSNSDHKSGKETEYLSYAVTPTTNRTVSNGVRVHPTCLKNTEKTPTEVDVDKSEANTGYSTTPEHDCLSLAVLSRMDL